MLDRILRELAGDPKRVYEFMNLMRDEPRGIELVRERYRTLGPSTEEEDREIRAMLKRWLRANSDEFAEDLERAASGVRDDRDYVTNHEELLALARADWSRAEPIVTRLYNDGTQKVAKVLATWALYRNALRTGGSDVDRYRDELKAVVEDKTAGPGARDLALDALVKEKDWSGRDDWFFSLLGDETLHELKVNGSTYTGLTTIMYYTKDEDLVPKLIELTQSDNVAVRTAAVKNLLLRLSRMSDLERNRELRVEIVRSLLPWFRDPKWVNWDGDQKQMLIRAIATVKIPEAVPALIEALDERETFNVPRHVSTTTNSATSNTNTAGGPAAAANSNRGYYSSQGERFPYRDAAIVALGKQADGRAVPALRRVLTQVEVYARSGVVEALLDCGGFTTEEQAAAIEFLARNAGIGDEDEESGGYEYSTPKGRARSMVRVAVSSRSTTVAPAKDADSDGADEEFESYGGGDETGEAAVAVSTANYSEPAPKPMTGEDLSYMLGTALVQEPEPGDELVRSVVARIDANEKRDPAVAETLRKILLSWSGRAVNALMLRDVKLGRVDPDAVVKLLALRRVLWEQQAADVSDVRTGAPTAQAIGACIAEDTGAMESILEAGSDAAKSAVFACARLIRAPLNVSKAAVHLRSPTRTIAMAAERYLESEDSPEARGLVLGLYPNRAKILGAKTAFEVEGTTASPGKFLIDLFATVNPYYGVDPYVYSTYAYDDSFAETEKRLRKEVMENAELLGVYAYDEHFVHIYADRAVFSWSDDPARYRERVLDAAEWENLKGYLAHHDVDRLPPFLACTGECDSHELLMLSRQGGRRVFAKTDRQPPEFLAGLDKIFTELRQRPAKLKYYAGTSAPGLEVHFAEDKRAAKSVWADGADIRVLVSDEERSKAIEREIAAMQEKEEDAQDGTPEYTFYQKYYNMREARKFDSYGWFRLAGERLADAVPQPAQAEYIPMKDGIAPPADWGRWKARTATFEIRADENGLYKISGGRSVRIRSGNYSEPVTTPDGRWTIATKYNDDTGPALVRVNLANNREFPVPPQNHYATRPVAPVPGTNLVLVTVDDEDHHGEEQGYGTPAYDDGRGYYLLNADTGVIRGSVGEVRPIAQQTFRGLQPTGTVPGEFWAALPRGSAGTLVGVYNARTFTFKPKLKLPKIIFDSTEMWVDGASGRAWFTYEGHLLSVPIK